MRRAGCARSSKEEETVPKKTDRETPPPGPFYAAKPCPCSATETLHEGQYSREHGDVVWACLGIPEGWSADKARPCGRGKVPGSKARSGDPEIRVTVGGPRDRDPLELVYGEEILIEDEGTAWSVHDMNGDRAGLVGYRDAGLLHAAAAAEFADRRKRKWPRRVLIANLAVWWTRGQCEAVALRLPDLIERKRAELVQELLAASAAG